MSVDPSSEWMSSGTRMALLSPLSSQSGEGGSVPLVRRSSLHSECGGPSSCPFTFGFSSSAPVEDSLGLPAGSSGILPRGVSSSETEEACVDGPSKSSGIEIGEAFMVAEPSLPGSAPPCLTTPVPSSVMISGKISKLSPVPE